MDLHPIYIGWFEHDGNWAVPDFSAGSRIAFPKVRRRLSIEDLSFDQSVSNALASCLTENGYIHIEPTAATGDVYAAARLLVSSLSCDILDRMLMVSSAKEQLG